MVNMETSTPPAVQPSAPAPSEPAPSAPALSAPSAPALSAPSKRQKKLSSRQPSKFYCPTCEVRCPNEATLQQHNTSKKHHSNISNIQRRDKHAMSSIFVGKLPKLARIRASLEEDTMGEGPGTATESTQNTMSDRENEKLRSDLSALFGVYGDISKIIIDKNHGSYCIIEYKAPAMAQVALSENQAGKIPLFYGKKLQIKSRKVTEIKPLTNIITHDGIQLDNIVALLEEAEDETEFGLGMVDNAISIQDQTRRKRNEACKRIQDQLKEVFPFHGVRLELYGSFQTGLSLVDSDLDMSLSVGPGKRLEREDLIKTLKEKCTGVSHVHLIPAPGHGTITRFLDGISNSMCDILFTNRLGLANTKLISTILSYDKRLGRLIRLAIYWNKVMLGARFAKQIIPSSYAVAIMVLHYLRQQNFLPDFFDKTLISSSDPQLIYDLDCSYVSDVTKFPAMPNSATVSGLLEGYWTYYGKHFDREGDVASLRGRLDKASVESKMGEEREATQHNYISTFRPSPLAVQDPFVLSHNLTQNVSLECAVLFGDLCRSSVANSRNNKPLYLWLFGEKEKKEEEKKEKKGKKKKKEKKEKKEEEKEEEEEEGGNTTPVWEPSVTECTPPHIGSKRSVEAMEH